MPSRIQTNSDTAANWKSVNPVLAQGEFGFEHDTRKVKIGDGASAWSSLGYAVEESLSTTGKAKLAGLQAGTQVNAVVSVHGRTGTIAAQPGDYTADQISDSAAKVIMPALERRKAPVLWEPQDPFWASINWDQSSSVRTQAYADRLAATLPPGRIGGSRELVPRPADYKTTNRPAGGLQKWWDAMFSQAFLDGRLILAEPSATACFEGPGHGYDPNGVWGDNIRWRIGNFVNHINSIPEQAARVVGIGGPGNEPDAGVGSESVQDLTRDVDRSGTLATDTAFNSSAAVKALIIDRYIDAARLVWKECRDKPRYATKPFPGWIGLGQFAYTTMTLARPGFQIFHLGEFFRARKGEALGYGDVLFVHLHNRQDHWPNFDGTPPAPNEQSFEHAWAAIALANSLRGPGNERLMPVATDEMGIAWNRMSKQGSWKNKSDTVIGAGHSHELRGYRYGMPLLAMCYYGVTLWANFCWGRAGDFDMNLLDHTNNDAPFPETARIIQILDYASYDIGLLPVTTGTTRSIPIVAKTWRDYNLPATWGVWMAQNEEPVSDFPGCPSSYWKRVKIAANLITCAAGGRNRVLRPIWLREIRRYRLSVDYTITGGGGAGNVKLRARGYDKLNGRAEETDTSEGTSGTLTVTFMPRQHAVAHLPNPAYVLFCLDHDGTGTASFRNATITAL